MNRFKFRVYNKRTEKMLDVRLISYFSTGNICRVEAQNAIGDIKIFDDYKTSIEDIELMQCTGLKDKNGKLIYEGDILKAYFENSDTGKTCFEYVPVGYDEEKLAFYTGKKFRALFAEGYFIPEEYEIVGNIYENKELLEDRKDAR